MSVAKLTCLNYLSFALFIFTEGEKILFSQKIAGE